MTCLNDETISRYIDNGFPAAETEPIAAHLGGCESCRRREQEMRADILYIAAKMAALEPDHIPQPHFVLPARSRRSFPYDVFRELKTLMALKPLSAAISLAVSILLIVILLFNGSAPDKKAKIPQVTVIRSVSIAGETAQAYIFADDDKHTIIAWIEKSKNL